MAIPSGSGTEVLKVYTTTVAGGSGEQNAIVGVANHIYTVLSIIICNVSSSDDEMFTIFIDDDGSTQTNLTKKTPVAAKSTFVWSDKFVLSGTDCLRIVPESAASFHIVCSYIDQDWS